MKYHVCLSIQLCNLQVQGVCEEEMHLTLWRDSEFLGVVCKVVHEAMKSVRVSIQHVCSSLSVNSVPTRGRAWVMGAEWGAGTSACLWLDVHPHFTFSWYSSISTLPAPSQVPSPACSGTARRQAILFPSFKPLSIRLLCCLCPVVCSHSHRSALTSSHPTLPVDSAAVHLSVPPTHTHSHTHAHTLDLHLWYIQLPLET